MGGIPGFNAASGWSGFGLFGIPPAAAGAFFTGLNTSGAADALEGAFAAQSDNPWEPPAHSSSFYDAPEPSPKNDLIPIIIIGAIILLVMRR